MILNVQRYVAENVMRMVVEQDVMEQKKVNKDLGLTVFIVEQYLDFVLGISDYLYLMEKGDIILQGETRNIPKDKVQKMMTE